MQAVDHQNGRTATPSVCTRFLPISRRTRSLTVSTTTAWRSGPPVRYALVPSDRMAMNVGQ